MMFWNLIWYRYSGVLSGTHPMMTGFFRQKDRHDRRPGWPKENIFQFAWRWIKDFVLDSSSYIQLFYEFQEIWFLTRPSKSDSLPKRRLLRLQHWSPLAQIKQRWELLKQRVAAYSWEGQYDAAVQELRSMLIATAHKLRTLQPTLTKRQTKDVDKVVGEIESCVAELETMPANPSLLYQTEQFIHDKLLSRYEALANRYVRLRREANVWRRGAILYLKRGRFMRCAWRLACRPLLAMMDIYLSIRFSIAAVRKEG